MIDPKELKRQAEDNIRYIKQSSQIILELENRKKHAHQGFNECKEQVLKLLDTNNSWIKPEEKELVNKLYESISKLHCKVI